MPGVEGASRSQHQQGAGVSLSFLSRLERYARPPPEARKFDVFLTVFLWRYHRRCAMVYVVVPQEKDRMGESKLDLLQGTLDVMVLQTLATMGPLHGYGIARRIEQISGDEVLLNQGTIYASLVRLQQRGWIHAEWGVSENNRKAKFYSITRAGRKQLAQDAAYWERLAGVMGRVLAMQNDGGAD